MSLDNTTRTKDPAYLKSSPEPPKKDQDGARPQALMSHFKQLLAQKRLTNHRPTMAACERENFSVKRPVTKKLKFAADHSDQQLKPVSSNIFDAKNLNVSCPEVARPIDRLVEENMGVLAQVAASTQSVEDINRLIKKLALSFTAKKNEAHFSIDQGLFQGSSFHLIINERHLSLSVRDASNAAKSLLSNSEALLVSRLAHHEINLREMTFIS